MKCQHNNIIHLYNPEAWKCRECDQLFIEKPEQPEEKPCPCLQGSPHVCKDGEALLSDSSWCPCSCHPKPKCDPYEGRCNTCRHFPSGKVDCPCSCHGEQKDLNEVIHKGLDKLYGEKCPCARWKCGELFRKEYCGCECHGGLISVKDSPQPPKEPKYAYWYEHDALHKLVDALVKKVESIEKRL